ncbi:septum formation family protein [Nocardioides cynanchi]|uniref:septum formation family protein n=1 Tax=Nocardioides cynanchi TaxID=2558918 RepID=UPI00177C07AF|nr:septum formation family protein [Nocardioides cynanchi]
MRLLAGVLAGLVLAGCSSSSGSSTPQVAATPLQSPTSSATVVSPAPPPPPPPAHACYRLGYTDALAPTSDLKPAPCTGPHTAVTFFVGRLPPDQPVDGPAVHHLVSTACPRRFASFVGGSVDDRRLSLLRTVWFTPTLEQAQAGARWFRCEAIAIRGDQDLAPLTGPIAGALDSDTTRQRFALCGTAEPGTAGFQQRICSSPHTWRALRTVDFAAGSYPGTDQVKAAGQTPCQDAAHAVAADPLNFRWSYQWPTPQQWRSGQTYGVCWAPS